MKCSKCEKEINDNCKFCSNCGKHIEKPETDIESLTKTCAKTWYILGFMKGAISDTMKDKKALERFEDALKKDHGEMWEWYQEIVAYWKEWASEQDDEKNKKTNGSKRASIPKTEKVKTK